RDNRDKGCGGRGNGRGGEERTAARAFWARYVMGFHALNQDPDHGTCQAITTIIYRTARASHKRATPESSGSGAAPLGPPARGYFWWPDVAWKGIGRPQRGRPPAHYRTATTTGSARPGGLALFHPLLERRHVLGHLLACFPADHQRHEDLADAVAGEVD